LKSTGQVWPATRRFLGTVLGGPPRWAGRKSREFISWLEKNNNLATAIIALAALVVSVVSVILTMVTLRDQRHHNMLSVKPIPMLTVFDGQEKLDVVLSNNGSGPLIVKDINVSDGKYVKKSVIAWMPELPEGMRWEAFASESSERSLAPGGEIALIRLVGRQSDPAFREVRDKCREALRKLTVTVKCTDIYESSMDPHEKKLSWFGRHKGPDASPGKQLR
jgi:hypothetical protein